MGLMKTGYVNIAGQTTIFFCECPSIKYELKINNKNHQCPVTVLRLLRCTRNHGRFGYNLLERGLAAKAPIPSLIIKL